MKQPSTKPAKAGPRLIFILFAGILLLASSPAVSQIATGSMDVHWNEGAPDCATNLQPPLQVHPYNPTTFILRENPCATAEAPFMYLLVGSTKALLIDTGDVSDPKKMPLAQTVLALLSRPDQFATAAPYRPHSWPSRSPPRRLAIRKSFKRSNCRYRSRSRSPILRLF